MLLIVLISLLVISILLIERRIVKRSVASLQLRVLVNGTRGKSSVTKYIASMLWSYDKNVMAKTTGSQPELLSQDSQKLLRRKGAARVQEQFRVVKLAAGQGIKKLVIECMTITPELQKLESAIFEPHIYVITNIYDDHREVMGVNLQAQAEAICSAIPRGSIVVTNEKRFLEKIRVKAGERGSRVVIPDKLPDEFQKKLPNGVFAENVSLAMSVCELAGLTVIEAKEAILKSVEGSPSAFKSVRTSGKSISFLDAFSVNDVHSTEGYISYWKGKLGTDSTYSVILNTRSDRPLRTDLLTSWISGRREEIDRVLISGSHRNRAAQRLKKLGYNEKDLHILKRKDLNDLKSRINLLIPDKSLLIGVGNIGEQGHKIIRELL